MPFVSPSRWVDVYLSASARAVSNLGDVLAATALVLALQQRGAGGGAVAAVLLAACVPPVLLAVPAGRMADRVDSRILLVTVGLIQAAVCAVMAYTTSIVMLVALAAVLAAGLAVTGPVLAALLPAMVSRADLPRAAAIGQSAAAIGAVAGPALGGLLVGGYGLRVPLLVDAVTYLAVTAAGMVIRTRRSGSAVIGGASDGDPAVVAQRPAVWRIRDDGLLLPLLVLFAVVAAALNATNVGYVFFVRDNLHASTTMYGIVEAAFAAGMPAGAWAAARATGADRRLALGLAGVLGGLSAVVLASAAVPRVGWLIALWLVGGVLNGGLNVWLGVLFAHRIPAERRGRVFALVGAVGNGAAAAGYLIGGAVIGLLAVRMVIALAGLAGLAGIAVLIWPLARAVRRSQAPVAPLATVAATGAG